MNKKAKHKHNPPGKGKPKPEETYPSEIGVKKWHRVFGWVTITHPYTPTGRTLVDSEYKHVQHFIGNKWVDYIGNGPDGNIIAINVAKMELYDAPRDDARQKLLEGIIKILK